VVAQIADLRRKGYLTDIGIKTDSHGEPDLESIQTLFNQAKSPYRTKNHAVMKGDLCEGKLYPSLRLNDPHTWFAGLPISGNNRLVQRDLQRRVDWLFWAMRGSSLSAMRRSLHHSTPEDSSTFSTNKVFAGSHGSVDDARAARRASVVAKIADLRRSGYLTDIGIKMDSHGEPDPASIQTLFDRATSPCHNTQDAVLYGDQRETMLYPSLRLNDPHTWFAGLPISGNNRLVQRDLKRRVDWLFWAIRKALRQLRSRKALRQLR